jgi:hypothetical protein
MKTHEDTIEACSVLLDACKDALDSSRDPEVRKELMECAKAGIRAKAIAMAAQHQARMGRAAS